MQVPFLGGEDAPEEELATHSSILVQKIPWTEESGGLQSMGSQRVDMTEQTHGHLTMPSFLNNAGNHDNRRTRIKNKITFCAK